MFIYTSLTTRGLRINLRPKTPPSNLPRFIILITFFFKIYQLIPITPRHLSGLSPNSTNVLNATQIYRSVSIPLSVEDEINCEKTEKTKTKWTVFKFDDDPRVLTTVPVSSLRKTAYRTDIFGLDLLLPENDLPYGFYEITARVEMKGLPDVFGTDSIYIQVIQTPWLQAAVVSGSYYSAPFGLTVSYLA